MHYGDDFHCQNNILVLGIYIHSIMGSEDVEIDVTSILEAKLCDPAELKRILKHPRRYFMRYDEIKTLQPEALYILTIVANALGEYRIINIEEISDQTEEAWKKLH